MRYLKLFENNYAEEISEDEYFNNKVNRETLPNKLYNKILDIIHDIDNYTFNDRYYGEQGDVPMYDITYIGMGNDKNIVFYFLDDYFYIIVKEHFSIVSGIRYGGHIKTYYKCDQLSSFIKFIKKMCL